MRYVVFLLAMLLVAAGAVCLPPFLGPSPPDGHDRSAAARLDASIGDRIAWRSIPGASVAIVTPDGTRQSWVAGRRSPLTGASITPQTQFEVASLSKPVTAYAALQLVQAGRLDLDAPIIRGGRTFTLRQLLSHTAGFDNILSEAPRPTDVGQRFRYSGAGYLVVAEEIERATGVGFAQYMNRTVLPGLGMSHSRFGAATDRRIVLANPSLDLAVPVLAVTAIAAGVGVPLLLLHEFSRRVVRRPPTWFVAGLPRAIFALSLLTGLGAVAWLLGLPNLTVPVAVAGLLGITGGAAILAGSRRRARRLVAAILILAVVVLLALRPALPMTPRKPVFLAAAGLRTTPDDYARFLQEVMSPRKLDPVLAALMRTPAVSVNPDNAWALGLGVHRAPRPAIWHWGVNYPGYQAFAIAVPETGQIVVIALNGGAITPRPGGPRYSGLDLARDGVTALGIPMGGTFWEGVP